MLTEKGCKDRRERFRQLMSQKMLDAVVVTDYRDVYYFSQSLGSVHLPVFLWLATDGHDSLIGPEGFGDACVVDHVTYQWNLSGTMNADLMQRVVDAMIASLGRTKKIRRVGWQAESMPQKLLQAIDQLATPGEWVAIDEYLTAMQRCLDLDELEVLRGSIAANCGAYDAVQRMIEPGVTELQVLAAGWAGAMKAAGEKVFHDGDYRCGLINGPARDRPVEAGEVYIIDAWTTYRGYWSDLSRSFIVSEEPTDLQQSIFDHIAGVQSKLGTMLRPGVRTTDLWQAMDEMIRQHAALADSGLIHHGGHGIGLRIHTPPDVNRDRGEALRIGDVICLEPGGYTPQARYGARIENTYLIIEEGAENLSPYPVELRCSNGTE